MIKSGEINNLIVENVNHLVTVIDEGYRFEYINETVVKKLTGYSNEDLIGKEVLSFIHLEDLMRSSVEFVKEAYKNGVINIDFSCSEDQLIVNANELLQDVFDNILINAMKYNENPNVEISINVSKTQVDGITFNKFEFTDNGIGVPDNRKKIIFKRGNRELKGSKGMGIGLSLVKKIIKSYNGKIWVEDKVKGDYSKGSNFILLIPDTV
ncbi:MAG: HAMP domain-containing sensor histidine kinase [Candidatus Lokiarchaeia archaeon]